MVIRKVIGILFLSVQAVVGADYYFQTRDAGLQWGEMSAADYAQIIQRRFDKAHKASEHGVGEQVALGGGTQLAQPSYREDESQESQAAKICVRRGTALNCQ
ncbi:hypothetical protein [Pseudophaeobacter sp.]|uniref:hypothetical protein n=1 Tax=Pseudophaeobacter sp. TaxID=1971739 RepID=UPI0032986CF4